MTSEKVVAVSRYKHEASMRDSYLYATHEASMQAPYLYAMLIKFLPLLS